MPQIRSAYKRLRQSKKRHLRNKAKISEIRSLAKNVDLLLSEKKKDKAEDALRLLESKLCKCVKTNTIKKETASRKISRLRSHLSKLK